MKPSPPSPRSRAPLFPGWRKGAAVAGVLSAVGFFAAAQAGSLDPIRVEVAGLLQPMQDNSPSGRVAGPKDGGHRTYSGGAGSGGGAYAGAARAPDAKGVGLGSIDWSADTETQATDEWSDGADSPF